jgi:hypothetical protein
MKTFPLHPINSTKAAVKIIYDFKHTRQEEKVEKLSTLSCEFMSEKKQFSRSLKSPITLMAKMLLFM